MTPELEDFQRRLMNAIYHHDDDVRIVIIHPDTERRLQNENEKYFALRGFDSQIKSTLRGIRVIRSTDVDEFEFDIY